MALTTFNPGELIRSSEVNENFVTAYRQSGRSLIRQLIDRAVSLQQYEFAEAYVNSTGRLNTVDTSKTSAIFDTNKYTADVSDEPLVIIEASSISAIGDFAINNCEISLIESGKWRLRCTTGTNEVRRAQIYKTLFYGTNGSDPRATSTYITGITALKTTVTRDVGKVAWYANTSTAEGFGTGSYTGAYTGTFVDTTNNTDCSVWSYVSASQGGSNGDTVTRVELPTSTTINTVTRGSFGVSNSDELGTDTESEEDDNPATIRLWQQSTGTSSSGHIHRVVILAEGNITWATAGTIDTVSNVNFNTTHSIPAMTLATAVPSIITHNIPAVSFPDDTRTVAVTPSVVDWEDGSKLEVRFRREAIPGPKVFIEASSLNPEDFNINDCKVVPNGSGKWILFATVGTAEERRAKIYGTLFQGTMPTVIGNISINPRVSLITGLTALKTTVSRDIGKRAFNMRMYTEVTVSGVRTYTGTFANTTTNTAASIWGRIFTTEGLGSPSSTDAGIQMPSGNYILRRNAIGGGTSNTFYIDASGDEDDNPNQVILRHNALASVTTASNLRALVLCEGGMSFATSGSGQVVEVTDFNDDGVPDLTDGTSEPVQAFETDWFDVDRNGSIVDFGVDAIQPTQADIKLIRRDVNPSSGVPSISGIAIFR